MNTVKRLFLWVTLSVMLGVLLHFMFPAARFEIGAMIACSVIAFLCGAIILDFHRARGHAMRGPEMTMLIPFCLSIAACTTLGLSTPQSFDEQLAEAYGVHTAVVSATATALTSGAITAQEARAAQTQENGARAMLDAARAIESTNASGAASDLQLASTALSAIQAYLNTVKPGSAPAQPAAPAAP